VVNSNSLATTNDALNQAIKKIKFVGDQSYMRLTKQRFVGT